jgi:uncharacterized protein YndB with AHSA1/START domain
VTRETKTATPRKRITIERIFDASVEDVWDLWTTKEGIESWWGPDGFSVKVHSIDLRPGGELHYAMIATAPDQVEFMRRAGMPTRSDVFIRYSEVVENERLRYVTLADFVPSIEPYEVETVVDLHSTPNGIRMVVMLEAMHDEHWTQMAAMGWESQLGRLQKVLAQGRTSGNRNRQHG